MNEQAGNSHSLEEKSNDAAESNNTVDSVDRTATEFLSGRVCYELEPLITDS